MTEQNGKSDPYSAVSMTITFSDGHTEEFSVFMAIVAEGMIPIHKNGEELYYAADGEKFITKGIMSVRSSMDIIAALLKTSDQLTNTLLGSLDGQGLISLLIHGTSMSSRMTILHDRHEKKTIDPRSN